MPELRAEEDGGLAEPRPPSAGPFERWPILTDLLLGLLSLAGTLSIWSRADWSLESLSGVTAYLLAFLAHFALLWRRNHPLAVHGLALAVFVVVEFFLSVEGLVALMVTLYSLGRYEADSRTSLLGALFAAFLIVIPLKPLSLPSTGALTSGVFVMVVWYLGRRLRFRGEYLRLLKERADQMARERDSEAERAVAAERTRIAREMHDVIAHQVSLMTVQAGAARTVMSRDPEAAGSAIGAVEQAGRQALAEMRHLLDVLRPVEKEQALGPQPGLADLGALIERVREAGPAVRLVLPDDASELSAGLQLACYRIVQEALTNVIKHAGDEVSVEVEVALNDNGLHIAVRDDGRGALSEHSGGHGLTGMRERAEMLGGSLIAGPAAEGGFKVMVQLPIEEDVE
ncbi:MAG: sensor histidine kinase [Pseudomonadota bacterium]